MRAALMATFIFSGLPLVHISGRPLSFLTLTPRVSGCVGDKSVSGRGAKWTRGRRCSDWTTALAKPAKPPKVTSKPPKSSAKPPKSRNHPDFIFKSPKSSAKSPKFSAKPPKSVAKPSRNHPKWFSRNFSPSLEDPYVGPTMTRPEYVHVDELSLIILKGRIAPPTYSQLSYQIYVLVVDLVSSSGLAPFK